MKLYGTVEEKALKVKMFFTAVLIDIQTRM